MHSKNRYQIIIKKFKYEKNIKKIYINKYKNININIIRKSFYRSKDI